MYLAGEIKGVLVAQLAKQFEIIADVRIDNLSPEAEVSLYRTFKKSVVVLQNEGANIRIEIPQSATDDVCSSITNGKNVGVATVMSSAGEVTSSLGEWVEDEEGVGFCSLGDIAKNKKVSLEDGIKRHTLAHGLLNALEWSFD